MKLVSTSLSLRLILLATAGFSYNLAQADTDCSSLLDSSKRLACYDVANGFFTKSTPAAASSTAAEAAMSNAEMHAEPLEEMAATGEPTSIIDASWGYGPDVEKHILGMYNSNYLLLGRYTDHKNETPYTQLPGNEEFNLNDVETKFQLSFKGRVWSSSDRSLGIWGAYTQNNSWQLYNKKQSRPFRETNYMPEVFISYRPDINLGLGFNWKLITAGYTHQSNGRNDELSRSWNRFFTEIGIENGNFAMYGKAWYRIPEKTRSDENPGITDFYGNGQLNAVYRWEGHSFTTLVQGNFSTGKGSVQLGWYSPPVLGALRAYVQGFSGYSETLADYNWRQNTIGIGFALNDGF